MQLNTLKPAEGSRPSSKRVGRGIGSTLGKTCGRGHKGQKSRSGGFHKVGFEGGQMPLQRRLPKVGFVSRSKNKTRELRLSELQYVEGDVISFETLLKAGLISKQIKRVKLIKSGEVKQAYQFKGIAVTKGAREAVEAAGGKVEE